jgi:hypothetical protein
MGDDGEGKHRQRHRLTPDRLPFSREMGEDPTASAAPFARHRRCSAPKRGRRRDCALPVNDIGHLEWTP